MAYKAEGKLHKIFDTEQKSATFQAREFVIEVSDGQYPQMIKFQLVQDKCTLVDDFAEGDEVEVEFDLRGREWNEKYFTNLQAWRISKSGDGETSAPPSSSANAGAPSPRNTPQQSPGSGETADFDDDIPF